MSDAVEIEIIRTLLKNFFQRSKVIYGLSFVRYNAHSVIHLLDEFIRYGNLERVSTFPFDELNIKLREAGVGCRIAKEAANNFFFTRMT